MEFIHLDIWSYCFLSRPMICISSYQYNELLTYVLVLTFVSGENSHPLNLNIEENLGNLKLLQMVNGVVLHMRNMTISVHHLPRHLILMMVRKIIKQTWIEGVLIFFFFPFAFLDLFPFVKLILVSIVFTCSNRRRQRPQRYSAKDFVEAVSDNDADYDSDDDIVGEAVYDEEYLKKRKERRKFSSSSEGDEEYHWDDENAEEEEEEEEEDDDSLSASEDDSDEPRKLRKLPGRTRRETKLRSVDELQSGLRRSKRATRNRINYRQYELSESEPESMKPEKSIASDAHSDASENGEYSMESQNSDGNDNDQEMKVDQPVEDYTETVEKEQQQPPEKPNSPGQDEIEGVRKRRFLDLNELAPGSGFDDGLNTVMKDEDTDDF